MIKLNLCHDEFILGNIKLYSHISSILITERVQVVEILPRQSKDLFIPQNQYHNAALNSKYLINTIPADALSPSAARASAAIIFM